MRLFKKGDKIVWHDPTEDANEGVVLADQRASDRFVHTKWFFVDAPPLFADFRPALIQLAEGVKTKNHVWVVEVCKDSNWVPLAAAGLRRVARRIKSAAHFKTRIRKYYSK